MYRNKLIRRGLVVVCIAVMVGLSYHIQNTLLMSSVKAASQKMPDGDLSVVGKPLLVAMVKHSSSDVLFV